MIPKKMLYNILIRLIRIFLNGTLYQSDLHNYPLISIFRSNRIESRGIYRDLKVDEIR